MTNSKPVGISIELNKDEVVIRVDIATANDLRYAIYVLGEHIAAGMQVPPMSTEMATRLGQLMRTLDGAMD